MIIHNNIQSESDAKQLYRELRKEEREMGVSEELKNKKRITRRILREFQQEKENDLLITKGVKQSGKRK